MDFVGKVESGSFEIRALCCIFFLVRYTSLQEIYVVILSPLYFIL